VADEREKILVIAADAADRMQLVQTLAGAGYQVAATESSADGFEAVRNADVDLLVMSANVADIGCCQTLSEVKGSAGTSDIRVVLITEGGSAERTRALDLGADDVLTHPWEAAELLARVRAQLRARRALEKLRAKMRIAEEGQQIAHTALQALAVTEKMTEDAFSLDRRLKIGVAAVLGLAVVMAALYVLFWRSAKREASRAHAVIAQFERGARNQRDLMAQVRQMRDEVAEGAPSSEEKQQLEKQSAELRAKLSAKDAGDVAALRRQLAETSSRLRRVEDESRVAQEIIRNSAASVCLLHVSVAFRDKDSKQHLRYAGTNQQGEPLQDSQGRPIYTLTGRGPEVRLEFFGSGFLVASDGRILTNRHLVEPWWKNEVLEAASKEGLEAVIGEISAYFPDSPRAYRVEIQKVSPDADLAVVQGDLSELKRSVLAIDASKGAIISGQPVVSVGYATGVAAILARAGEETVNSILAQTNGSAKQVIAELARRKLIRPLTTQGHIGDVLPDKIVFDAATTSGGSGGPLFNQEGKVVGVTFAVVRGFGGSNFGIPIRFAQPLLK